MFRCLLKDSGEINMGWGDALSNQLTYIPFQAGSSNQKGELSFLHM